MKQSDDVFRARFPSNGEWGEDERITQTRMRNQHPAMEETLFLLN